MSNQDICHQHDDSIIIDLDNTLTLESELNYDKKEPNKQVIETCHKYKELGFRIIVFTSRNMRKFNKDVNLIKANTLPKIKSWLDKNNVPYDQIIIGKPWCGKRGFYVDDRAIRPSEFVSIPYTEIMKKIEDQK
jgi:capsule biosynthesis phosphatase